MLNCTKIFTKNLMLLKKKVMALQRKEKLKKKQRTPILLVLIRLEAKKHARHCFKKQFPRWFKKKSLCPFTPQELKKSTKLFLSI